MPGMVPPLVGGRFDLRQTGSPGGGSLSARADAAIPVAEIGAAVHRGLGPPASRAVRTSLAEVRMEGAMRESTEGAPVDLNDLRRRLETSPVIEQAKGVLMGFYGCDADAAFALLRCWSSHRNRKLHLVCADLLAAAATPTRRPFGGLQDAIESFGHRTRGSDLGRASGAPDD